MNRQSLVRFATITLMLTTRQRATFHVVVCHVSSLLAIFILVVPVLARDVLAQPTLKEVIEGKEKEKGGAETKAEGQKTDEPQPKTAPAAIADDEFGRGAPRASIQSFLAVTRKGDYERAAHYLDLRRLPSEQRERLGPELARHSRSFSTGPCGSISTF